MQPLATLHKATQVNIATEKVLRNRWSAVSRTERYRKRCGDEGSAAVDESNPLPHFIDPITLEPVVTPAISPWGHVMGLATWKVSFRQPLVFWSVIVAVTESYTLSRRHCWDRPMACCHPRRLLLGSRYLPLPSGRYQFNALSSLCRVSCGSVCVCCCNVTVSKKRKMVTREMVQCRSSVVNS